ncbi:MAG: DUF4058 family protein [Chloroflexi bacterium]|nr:DUF4058 family protein [Chloroflexota bacterium]
MPSPFPGMDPYLEARAVWPDVHQRLITYISEALQPQLRPQYVARIGERVQLANISRSYVPDVLLVHTLREPAPTLTTAAPLVADEPQLITSLDDTIHIPYIEIIARETGDVVTLIELLSPANKMGDGRNQYIQKQGDLLLTDVNLVEIDLLSYGKETVLARNSLLIEPADWRYLINISRTGRRNALELYAIPLSGKLPNCRIPLRPPDADAVLNLAAVFSRSYDVGGYDLLIDYSQPPSAPLCDAEAAWLDVLLQEKGLRPSALD